MSCKECLPSILAIERSSTSAGSPDKSNVYLNLSTLTFSLSSVVSLLLLDFHINYQTFSFLPWKQSTQTILSTCIMSKVCSKVVAVPERTL